MEQWVCSSADMVSVARGNPLLGPQTQVAGLEPATFGFVDRCSIQLSYTCRGVPEWGAGGKGIAPCPPRQGRSEPPKPIWLTLRRDSAILPDSNPVPRWARFGCVGDSLVPNTQARKKQIRQDANRRARNRWRMGIIKAHTKDALKAIQDGDVESAEAAFKLVQKAVDRISTTSTMHRNQAARRKSRLSRRIKAMKQAS